jgi:hypothetical protein
LKINFGAPTLKCTIKGLSSQTSNIFIFYGILTIYKSFIHILNDFPGPFDHEKHFFHLVFGRILAEYHAARRGGEAFLDKFHGKWSIFKIYDMQGTNIAIKNFLMLF